MDKPIAPSSETAPKAAPCPGDDLQGPVLSWGEPCGRYSLEIVKGGAVLRYRIGGGEIAIPFDERSLAEAQGMFGMLTFNFKVEIPDGKILGHA